MKQALIFLFVISSVLASAHGQPLAEERLKVSTYNIRLFHAEIPPARVKLIRQVVEILDADIIGLQEIKDREALALVFDPAEWWLVIDDDNNRGLDLAFAISRRLSVTGFEVDKSGTGFNAEDGNYLAPDKSLNNCFPDRRDVLWARITAPETDYSFIALVTHAKSRVGGRKKTTERRICASQEIVKQLKSKFEDESIIFMGDLNDSPDGRSANILETGDENAIDQIEDDPGEFLINLTEPLYEMDYVTYMEEPRPVESGKIKLSEDGARDRDFACRNQNSVRGCKPFDQLFDQILVSPDMYEFYLSGSIQIFDNPVAVTGDPDTVPSDHLPVSAEFLLPKALPKN